MRLCDCRRSISDTITRDRLRCSGCGGWRPNGSPRSRVDFAELAAEVSSLVENATKEFSWLEGALYGLQRRGADPGRASGPSDPTGVLAASEVHDRARSWATLASRLLERGRAELDRADQCVGEARYAIDLGPPIKVDYVVRDVVCPGCHGAGRVSVVPEGREDLRVLHAAQGRRFVRGEGVPS